MKPFTQEFVEEFQGHPEHGTPLVGIDVSVYGMLPTSGDDLHEVILTVGGLHVHLGPAGVYFLMDALHAACDPAALAEEMLVEENATPEVLAMLVKFLTGAREAALARLQGTER